MKRLLTLAAVAAVVLWAGTARAVPAAFTYSGFLLDSAGHPVTTPTDVTFNFWDADGSSTVTPGNLLATDGPITVTPSSEGFFSALVGSSLTTAFYKGDVWMSLKVGAEPDMLPRMAITSVPSASSFRGNAPLSLPFFPVAPVAGCSTAAVGGQTFGSTVSTTALTVGIMFFDQDPIWLNSSYSSAKLVVLCRGSGTFTLSTNSCTTTVATVNCASGVRPWTAASAEFPLDVSADYNLQVTAGAASTLEWANPQLLVY